MAVIKLESLEVTSFVAQDSVPDVASLAKTVAKTCDPDCEWICTGDISTCSRTSREGGCDTSVQCVTG